MKSLMEQTKYANEKFENFVTKNLKSGWNKQRYAFEKFEIFKKVEKLMEPMGFHPPSGLRFNGNRFSTKLKTPICVNERLELIFKKLTFDSNRKIFL